VPTHYAIRSVRAGTGGGHLKSWLVERSLDGCKWGEVDCRENEMELNSSRALAMFAVAASQPCKFIRLVNICRNWRRDDCMMTEAWELVGTLLD
jgi:hypothetical protein